MCCNMSGILGGAPMQSVHVFLSWNGEKDFLSVHNESQMPQEADLQQVTDVWIQ